MSDRALILNLIKAMIRSAKFFISLLEKVANGDVV